MLRCASAFDTLIDRAKAAKPNATIWGVQIQEMVTNAREVIIGMNRDPQFGPLVMFGLGGIYVEVLKDVDLPRGAHVAPAGQRDGAADPLLQAADRRARPGALPIWTPSSIRILRVSQLVTDFPEIAEMDINPLVGA